MVYSIFSLSGFLAFSVCHKILSVKGVTGEVSKMGKDIPGQENGEQGIKEGTRGE